MVDPSDNEFQEPEHLRLFRRLDILIRTLRNHGFGHLGRLFADLDITGTEALALERIWSKDGLSQSTLANLMTADPGLVSRMLSRLIRRGFIRSEADPADRRLKRIFMTEEGRTLFANECIPRFEEFTRQRVELTSIPHMKQLIALMEQIAEGAGVPIEDE